MLLALQPSRFRDIRWPAHSLRGALDLDTFYISHGAPDLLLRQSPARTFLESLSAQLGQPRAIAVVSAHFMTRIPAVVHDASPGMIYDFGGFPEELYRIVYPAPGDSEIAERIATLMGEAGLAPALVDGRGFDHGTWVPLRLIYPDATMPLVQIAVQPHETPAHHFRMGQALRRLADDNVALIGSGSATHNLRAYFGQGLPVDHPMLDWVEDFSAWLNDKIVVGDIDALLDYRSKAPHAVENHPTDEHLLPLFVALGAAPEGARGRRLHASVEGGVLLMDAYAFS